MPINEKTSENHISRFSFAYVESLWTQAVSSESSEDIKNYLLELDSFLERLDMLPPEDRIFDEQVRQEMMRAISPLVFDKEGHSITNPNIPIINVIALGFSPDLIRGVIPDGVDQLVIATREKLFRGV